MQAYKVYKVYTNAQINYDMFYADDSSPATGAVTATATATAKATATATAKATNTDPVTDTRSMVFRTCAQKLCYHQCFGYFMMYRK